MVILKLYTIYQFSNIKIYIPLVNIKNHAKFEHLRNSDEDKKIIKLVLSCRLYPNKDFV